VEGFDAIGKPIPGTRKSAAYRAMKDMVPGIGVEDAMAVVGQVADRLERDDPYGALAIVTGAPLARDASSPQQAVTDRTPVQLDVTGGYRLFAHLLTGPAS
jgi:hypothetical protein